MAPPAAPWTRFRRAALPLTLVLLLLPATAVRAQRLLTLVPGVGAASSADGPGPSIGPLPTAVQVDLELLRSGPAWLETPTPDGSVLWAERSVFEDRGGGDLMWSGGHPDAGYDTVVLTVEGGRLVGRFAAAGGGAYQIHAERDGRGGMAPIGGPRPLGPDGTPEPFCAVETAAEDPLHAAAHARAGAAAADPPRRVSQPQSHDRLDILVAYTATAAENWADRGGAMAAIRHAGDYLKMVFRNNELPVEPHIVHVAQASSALDRVGRELRFPKMALLEHFREDGELLRLRHEHRADLVHLFTGEGPAFFSACGQHFPLQRYHTVRSYHTSAYGWTSNDAYCDYATTFVHEIGHGLGADHDPRNATWPEHLIRPYAFGHANWQVMPNIGTVMSYHGQREPFFSTPRIRPWGAVVGIADERDNERLLRETVHVGVRYSDYLRSLEGIPAPPGNARIWLEGAAARLSWQDNAPDADGYEVRCSQLGTQNVIVRRAESRSGATIPLEHREPGTWYLCEVWATKGEERSLSSGHIHLVIPGEPLEAPSDVWVDQSDGLSVHWADNSDNERGFEVLLLDGGEPIGRRWAWAGETTVFFESWRIQPRDREYEVRVFATHGTAHSESSEPVTFRWRHPLAPKPVADLDATAIGPTTIRVAWTGNQESEEYVVSANLRGWQHWARASGDAGWVDFEGLARGGRYEFEVWASNEYGRSVSKRTHLTLGARGQGPRAPSDLAWVIEGDLARLSWKDNSADELGFEVQWALRRLALLPPDTESTLVSSRYFSPSFRPSGLGGVKVFAYNERGFSEGIASEKPIRLPEASFRLDIPCGDELCRALAGARVSFADTSSGNVTRWRWSFGDGAESDLRFPTHVWSSPGYYDVTLTVREGATRPSSATRTVLVGPATPAGACRADAETLCMQDSRFEATMEWRTAGGESGAGQAVHAGTNDSGLFYFFDPENWEVLIKVLDGCAINGRLWVLGASTTDLGYRIRIVDTVTGESRSYANEPGRPAPAIVDVDAFSDACAAAATGAAPSAGAPGAAASGWLGARARESMPGVVAAEQGWGSCESFPADLCLRDRRFSARVWTYTSDRDRLAGRVARAGTDTSGVFYFFDPENWEVLLKVLDGCAVNGHYWVFAASATDLELGLMVKDTVTDASRRYRTRPGQPAPAIVDTEAFACAAGAAAQ